MDRGRISLIAHAAHPIAAPVGDDAVRRLLGAVVRTGNETLLDLGCGRGEWLIRALAQHPAVHAVGVDRSGDALKAAASAAERAGVTGRLELHETDAASYQSTRTYDVVLCIAATHAFGGLAETLAAARTHLNPGGLLLLGEGMWEGEPTPAALETLGPLPQPAQLVDQVVTAGWTPLTGHFSTREELDAYEWAWTGSLAGWALEAADTGDSAEALSIAADHRHEWLHGYRDHFGFGCLVVHAGDVHPG